MTKARHRSTRLAVALAGMVALSACAVDRTTGDRTLTGATVGAAGGAATGLLFGGFVGKTVTGAVAGAAGGFAYDQIQKARQN
jgi:osmotically inducible lipoprotein OsmB